MVSGRVDTYEARLNDDERDERGDVERDRDHEVRESMWLESTRLESTRLLSTTLESIALREYRLESM